MISGMDVMTGIKIISGMDVMTRGKDVITGV